MLLACVTAANDFLNKGSNGQSYLDLIPKASTDKDLSSENDNDDDDDEEVFEASTGKSRSPVPVARSSHWRKFIQEFVYPHAQHE